jgi:hypothetical protein
MEIMVCLSGFVLWSGVERLHFRWETNWREIRTEVGK